MRGIKKHWDKTYQYLRILEILEDYWLNVKDEEYVAVCMYFKKHDGQQQVKQIRWRNPNYPTNEPLKIVSLAEIDTHDKCELWEEALNR